MSLNELILNQHKKYLNARVNNLIVDGTYTGPFPAPQPNEIPINSLKSEGLPPKFIHDNGVDITKKDIEITDLQNIQGGASDGTYLRHNLGTVSFSNIQSSDIASSGGNGVLFDNSVNVSPTLTPIVDTLTAGISMSTGIFSSNTIGTSGNIISGGDIQANNLLGNLSENFVSPSANNNDVLTTIAGNTVWSAPTSNNIARHITVGQSGADYNNLSDAIAAAILLTPTASNPIQIQLFPGSYVLTNPLTIPSYVLVTSLSDTSNKNVILNCSDNLSSGIIMSNESSIDGFHITNCSTGILFSSGTSRASNVTCDTVISGFVTNSGAVSVLKSCTVFAIAGNTITNSYLNQSGGLTFGNDLYARSVGGTINTAFACSAVGSNMFLDNCVSIGCLISSNVSGGGIINLDSGRSLNTTITAHIVAGGTLNMNSHSTISITGNDLDVDATGKCYLQSCRIHADKIKRVNGSQILGNYFSETIGDISMKIEGNLSVGVIGSASETYLGGGGAYTSGMKVFYCDSTSNLDNGSNFVDVTNNVLLPDGNVIKMFAGLNINRTLLIGSTLGRFAGNFFKIPAAIAPIGAQTSGTHHILFEYYDGIDWKSTNLMSTNSQPKYESKADKIFELGEFEYRYGYSPIQQAPVTINGINALWFRFRVVVALTTLGDIEQIKLHPRGRLEVKKDGFVEIFNDETSGSKQLLLNAQAPIGGNNAAAQDIFLSSQPLGVGLTTNNFVSGVLDRSSFGLTIEENLDTSKPLNLIFRYIQTTAEVNNVLFRVKAARLCDIIDEPGNLSNAYLSSVTSPISAPGELINLTDNLATDLNNLKLKSIIIPVDVSSIITKRTSGSGLSDLLLFTFERVGTDVLDTYGGNISMVDISYTYTKWRL